MLRVLRVFHVGHVVQNSRLAETKEIAPNSVPHVQHDYSSSFNQSNQ